MSCQKIDHWLEELYECKLIPERDVKELCVLTREILINEANVVSVSAPITIVGDIHGQFYDLKELFKIGGFVPETNYLFLGDFVDRGIYSVETFLLVLALKLRYPERIILLRGNHETRQITQVYGFYDECLRKYGSVNVWRYCTEVFDALAIGAVIDNSVFCVHGGLSPSLNAIDEINNLQRVRECPMDNIMTDLLWSDPDCDMVDVWKISSRGAGYQFGAAAVEHFCGVNDIDLIARAHQMILEGYRIIFDEKLVTVWSAPNYTYRCGNVASILELNENLDQVYKIFEKAPEEERGIGNIKPVLDYWL